MRRRALAVGARLRRARRARRARLAQFEDANGYFREAIAMAPGDACDRHALGRAVSREASMGRRREVLSGGAEESTRLRTGARRARAGGRPGQSAGRGAFVRRALELNPSDAGAHLFLAELATFEDKKDEAREAIAKALAINPNSLEALRAGRPRSTTSRARTPNTSRPSARR